MYITMFSYSLRKYYYINKLQRYMTKQLFSLVHNGQKSFNSESLKSLMNPILISQRKEAE